MKKFFVIVLVSLFLVPAGNVLAREQKPLEGVKDAARNGSSAARDIGRALDSFGLGPRAARERQRAEEMAARNAGRLPDHRVRQAKAEAEIAEAEAQTAKAKAQAETLRVRAELEQAELDLEAQRLENERLKADIERLRLEKEKLELQKELEQKKEEE